MAPSIQDVMEGVAGQLETISGLRVSAYESNSINVPQAVVLVPEIPDYRASMKRGTFVLEVRVQVYTSTATDRSGQQQLAAYANPTGSSSVIAAIEADTTLGGVVNDCVVDSFRRLGVEEAMGIGFYGGEFTLRVVASGV